MMLANQLKLLSSTYCDRNPGAVVQKAAPLCLSRGRGIDSLSLKITVGKVAVPAKLNGQCS